MTRFATLLGEDCCIVEARDRDGWSAGLLEAERGPTLGMNRQRLREYTAGRNCARAALVQLGFPALAIGKGSGGEPLFPPGVTGSISHTENYCAAALALNRHIAALGIDAQTNRPMEAPLYRRVLGRPPTKDFATQGFCEGTLLFSIREAFYKAIFSFCQRHVYAADLIVELSADPGHCAIHSLTPDLESCLAPFTVDVRYTFDEQRIYSAVSLRER